MYFHFRNSAIPLNRTTVRTFGLILLLTCLPIHAQTDLGQDTRTNWFKVPKWMEQSSTRQLPAEDIEKLEALGYLGGYVPHTGQSNVIINDVAHVFPGYNLYVSGHAPIIVLADLNGRELHRWERGFRDVWPDTDSRLAEYGLKPTGFFSFAHLYPNGDILALYNGLGLVKLDKDSNVIWKFRGDHQDTFGGSHHHFTFSKNDEIIVLTHLYKKMIFDKSERLWREDFVVTLDANGLEIDRFSLSDSFEQSNYASLLAGTFLSFDGVPSLELHTNFIQVLDGSLQKRIPQFRSGNLLVSCRDISTIAVVDAETKKVIWALTGQWLRQHSPTVLPTGKILLFDNLGHAPQLGGALSPRYKGSSRILEFDPVSQEVEWVYSGTSEMPFDCFKMGLCSRLPNGNTFVTDAVSGRAFEVTAEKNIVWQWVSPHRSGSSEEFIASLPMMTRIPESFPIDWAAPPQSHRQESSTK